MAELPNKPPYFLYDVLSELLLVLPKRPPAGPADGAVDPNKPPVGVVEPNSPPEELPKREEVAGLFYGLDEVLPNSPGVGLLF